MSRDPLSPSGSSNNLIIRLVIVRRNTLTACKMGSFSFLLLSPDFFLKSETLSECQMVSIQTWPEVIKLFSCSTQLSTKFILLINVKMPTIVGILTFMSMINATSERLKVKHFFICWYFSFYAQLKFRAQLS